MASPPVREQEPNPGASRLAHRADQDMAQDLGFRQHKSFKREVREYRNKPSRINRKKTDWHEDT